MYFSCLCGGGIYYNIMYKSIYDDVAVLEIGITLLIVKRMLQNKGVPTLKIMQWFFFSPV